MQPSFKGSDGTELSLSIERGPAGSPTLLFINGLACPHMYWEGMRNAFRGRGTLVSFDLKGHGTSDPARTAGGATIEGCARDAVLALDAANARDAVVFGFSLGCQIGLEISRAHSDRVAGYVLALGAFEMPFATVLSGKLGPVPHAVISSVPTAFVRMSLKWGGRMMTSGYAHRLAQRASMVGKNTPLAVMSPFYKHMGSIDAGTWIALAQSARDHSAATLLSAIRVPTLVVAGGRDTLTPPSVGRTMAEGIPGADYLEIPNATHTGLLDEETAIVGGVHRFFERNGLSRAAETPRQVT